MKQKTDILDFTTNTLDTLSQWVTCNSNDPNVVNAHNECTVHLNNHYIDFYLNNTIQIQSDFSKGLKKEIGELNREDLINAIKKSKPLTTGQKNQIENIVAANNINCCKYTNDEWSEYLENYTSQTISIYEFQLRILNKITNNDASFNEDMNLIQPFITNGIINIPIKKLSKDIQDILKDSIDEKQTCTIDNVKYAIYILYCHYYISDDIQRWFDDQKSKEEKIFNKLFIKELDRLRNVSYDNFMNYVKTRLTPSGAMYNQYVYDIEC